MTTASSSPARTRVLVVGAGPVGLMTAIRLRKQGIDVRVIDQQAAEDARNYPVVLHARSLRILSALGIAAPLCWRGHQLEHLTVSTERERRATLKLSGADQLSPGALTLPQDVLRQTLTRVLAGLGVDIDWNCRLVNVEQDTEQALAIIVRRQLTEGKPPERYLEWRDVDTLLLRAEFVVGADGHDSTVRKLLGVELHAHGPVESYQFFDARDRRAGTVAQLAIVDGLRSSIYPLQGELARFSFQVMSLPREAADHAQLKELLVSRLPWRADDIGALEWSGSAKFRQALAARFALGRVWLAGDSAHSTGPLGAHGINVGLHEASEVALRIGDYLKRPSVGSFEERYDAQRQLEWRMLLGFGGGAPMSARAPAWLQRNIDALLSCLPASGDDLEDLLEQLRAGGAQQ